METSTEPELRLSALSLSSGLSDERLHAVRAIFRRLSDSRVKDQHSHDELRKMSSIFLLPARRFALHLSTKSKNCSLFLSSLSLSLFLSHGDDVTSVELKTEKFLDSKKLFGKVSQDGASGCGTSRKTHCVCPRILAL